MIFRVREIEESDLEMIMRWRIAPYITKFMNTDPHLTLETQKIWFKNLATDIHSIYWLIEVDGKPAGIIDLRNIDWVGKTASWGYYIGEKALRSLKLAISLEMSLYDFVFDYLHFKELKCETFSENSSVIQLHLACGSSIIQEEKNGVEKNGIYYDIVHMSITAQHWNKIKKQKKYEKISFIPGYKVHHIAIAVVNMQDSINSFIELGYIPEITSIYDKERNVNISFMKNSIDHTRIELIEPGEGINPVSTLLKKMKGVSIPYHFCYETRNIKRTIMELQSNGYIVISQPSPAIAFGGDQVAFLLKKETGCLELLESRKE